MGRLVRCVRRPRDQQDDCPDDREADESYDDERGVTSIRITATIVTGLRATPDGERERLPERAAHLPVCCERQVFSTPGRVSAQITQTQRAITRIDQNG